MAGVFYFDLQIDLPDADDLVELKHESPESVAQTQPLPLLNQYVDLKNNLVKLQEGTGGSIMKSRCLSNRQSVVVKILKRFVDSPACLPQPSIDINDMTSQMNSISIKNDGNTRGVRTRVGSLDSMISDIVPMADCESTEPSSSLSKVTTTTTISRKERSNYTFDCINEYCVMKRAESEHITPAYGFLLNADLH